MKYKKHPKLNLENNRNSYFLVGLVVALSTVLIAFEWQSIKLTQRIAQTSSLDHFLDIELVEEVTIEKIKENSPSETPKNEAINENLVEEITTTPQANMDNIKVVDNNKNETEGLNFSFAGKVTAMPESKPPLVETEFDVHAISFKPTFKKCNSIVDGTERQTCTEQTIFSFLRDNIKYPELCKEIGEQGTVYVQFVINKKGKVTKVKGRSRSHELLIKEAERVVKLLPDFIPGRQGIESVNVKYNIPVVFRLNR